MSASHENLKSVPDLADWPSDLLSLYASHEGNCSDKWEANLHRYVTLFEPLRDQALRFLEVGVQNGGSLEIWAKYFPVAKAIIGCDIDSRCSSLQYADSRIHLLIGDILKPDTLAQLFTISPEFDVIIDDGSHRSDDVIGTFCSLFPTLAEGGLYLIEDLHCSYWEQFHGGLFAPHSAISFLKALCDIVNQQHWGLPVPADRVLNEAFREHVARMPAEQLRHIHSVEFSNSLCIIRKETPARNSLGRRIVAGKHAAVHPVVLSLADNLCIAPDQASNEWSKTVLTLPDASGLESSKIGNTESPGVGSGEDEAAALHAQIREMRAGIIGLQTELATIKRLWSWRLMSPFRNLWRLPGRVRRQWRRKFGGES